MACSHWHRFVAWRKAEAGSRLFGLQDWLTEGGGRRIDFKLIGRCFSRGYWGELFFRNGPRRQGRPDGRADTAFSKFSLFFVAQRLVGLPFSLLFLGAQLFGQFVGAGKVQPGFGPCARAEGCPFGHTAVHFGFVIWAQRRVIEGDFEPFAFLAIAQACPAFSQRLQGLLLGGREQGPVLFAWCGSCLFVGDGFCNWSSGVARLCQGRKSKCGPYADKGENSDAPYPREYQQTARNQGHLYGSG